MNASPHSLRDLAARLLRAALHAVEPRAVVRRALRLEGETLHVGEEQIDLRTIERVRLVGAGKAACAMAQGALDMLGERISDGTLTTRKGYASPVPGIEVWEASHPIPDTHGLAGAGEALHLARGAGERDLLLCLLSGGASALWPAPPRGVSLGELQQVTEALLRAGAPIQELNAVRKHLSRISGGQLARAAHPAHVLSLILSDVVGSPLDVIASGPTVPDPTTFQDALAVLARYGVRPPRGVLTHLQAGAAGEIEETPKSGDPAFARATAHIVARNRDALEGAAREARELGLEARIVTDALEGEARDAAAEIVRQALRAREEAAPGAAPLALLWGGETTVTVQGEGSGGRSQELALAAATLLEGEEGILLAALGTDGTDGPTDAAGGVVDGGTLARGQEQGLDARDHLARNDAYTFLQAAADLLVTGPTGTNVNDVVLALIEG
ncbi:MAG TPA: glycerate kinase [Longimicrobiaceae bacterium]|nr:glycerate kinase [Longimicrobiaceae bacterium]